jgi:hypothetical protein
MPPRNPAQMTPEERAAKVGALKPEWAKTYIRQLEGITRHLAAQLAAAQQAVTGVTEIADHARDELRQRDSESAPGLPGITPPSGEYATIRVLDGRANMKPVADLPEGAEIRFADFYQVHYGSGEGAGGARVLVVETDQPMVVQPMAPYRIIITRAG